MNMNIEELETIIAPNWFARVVVKATEVVHDVVIAAKNLLV